MKTFLIIIVSLIAALLVVAAVLPKDFKIERSVIIDRPKSEVFAYLKPMENAKNWQIWSKLDPNMHTELKGQDGTVGAVSSWTGNAKVGVGEEEIKGMTENQRIDYELRFKEPMVATNAAYIITEDFEDNQTKVTWGMSGRTPFPFNIFCHMMRGSVENDFQTSLNDLKKILENEAQAAPAAAEEATAI